MKSQEHNHFSPSQFIKMLKFLIGEVLNELNTEYEIKDK
jgi:hypothetical protein